MLNKLWPGFIIISFIYAVFKFNMNELNNAIFESCKQTVEMILSFIGVMCMWNGIMEIIKETTLINKITKCLSPLMKFLFPDIKRENKAYKEISMNIAISNYWHDIMGMSPAAKARELFNLMYEKMCRPELCYEDFDEIRKDEMERFGKESVLEQMMKRASDRMLTNRLDSLMGNTVPRPALTKMDLERLDLDKIADYYCSLYSNPSQMTFVVTGKFDTDSIKELLTATFGRMPKVNTVSYPNKAFKLPKKTYIEEFPNDNDTQTIFDYVFCGNYQPSLKNSLTLKLMRDILQNRLLSVLREGENIVYSPYASLFYNGLPQQVFYFDLSASVDFVNTKKVEELIKQIINELRTSKVSEEELETLKKSFWVTKRKVLSDEASAEWRTNLVNLLKNGESVADFERYEQCLNSISTVDIQKAFKHFTNPDKFVLLYIGKHQKYE